MRACQPKTVWEALQQPGMRLRPDKGMVIASCRQPDHASATPVGGPSLQGCDLDMFWWVPGSLGPVPTYAHPPNTTHAL